MKIHSIIKIPLDIREEWIFYSNSGLIINSCERIFNRLGRNWSDSVASFCFPKFRSRNVENMKIAEEFGPIISCNASCWLNETCCFTSDHIASRRVASRHVTSLTYGRLSVITLKAAIHSKKKTQVESLWRKKYRERRRNYSSLFLFLSLASLIIISNRRTSISEKRHGTKKMSLRVKRRIFKIEAMCLPDIRANTLARCR